MINNQEQINELKRKKLLLQLESEINKLEDEIKSQQIKNMKIKLIRRTKIGTSIISSLAPYTITLLLVTAGTKQITGGYPFIRDSIRKIPAKITKEIDSLGNIEEKKQYTENYIGPDEIYLYKNWKYNNEEDIYTRDIEIYEVYDLKEEITNDLINLENINITDILGTPEYLENEKKEKLTSEEINANEYIKIITHTENKDDYISKKESMITNIIVSISYLYGLTIFEFMTLLYKVIKNKSSLKEKIERIKINYPYIDKDTKKRKLEIKKENYKRLTENNENK